MKDSKLTKAFMDDREASAQLERAKQIRSQATTEEDKAKANENVKSAARILSKVRATYHTMWKQGREQDRGTAYTEGE